MICQECRELSKSGLKVFLEATNDEYRLSPGGYFASLNGQHARQSLVEILLLGWKSQATRELSSELLHRCTRSHGPNEPEIGFFTSFRWRVLYFSTDFAFVLVPEFRIFRRCPYFKRALRTFHACASRGLFASDQRRGAAPPTSPPPALRSHMAKANLGAERRGSPAADARSCALGLLQGQHGLSGRHDLSERPRRTRMTARASMPHRRKPSTAAHLRVRKGPFLFRCLVT